MPLYDVAFRSIYDCTKSHSRAVRLYRSLSDSSSFERLSSITSLLKLARGEFVPLSPAAVLFYNGTIDRLANC
jgi:hypothetical protein